MGAWLVLALATPTQGQGSAPSGIEAWLPSAATDYVDPNAVVSSVGAVGCPFGKVGRAVEFTGPGAVNATYSDPVDIAAGADFTIEGWAFWDPSGNAGAGNFLVGDGFGNSGVTVMAAAFGPNYFHMHYGGSTTSLTASAGVPLPGNRWVHFAVRYEGGLVSFFFDGVLVGWDVITSSGNAPRFLTHGVQLGHNGAGWFAGLLDEVSLYSRALSDTEIEGIHLAGSSGKGAPLPTAKVRLPPGGFGLGAGIRAYPSGFHYDFDGSQSTRETSHVWSLQRLVLRRKRFSWATVASFGTCGAASSFSFNSLSTGFYRVEVGVQNDAAGTFASRIFVAGL